MKDGIQDLRRHLFAAIEGLLDKDKPLDIDRAKAVADVAQVAVNSAKVEVDFLRTAEAMGMRLPAGAEFGTGFITNNKPDLKRIK